MNTCHVMRVAYPSHFTVKQMDRMRDVCYSKVLIEIELDKTLSRDEKDRLKKEVTAQSAVAFEEL
jgi:cell division protein FtsX